MVYAVRHGVDFSNSLMLGRQTCYALPEQIISILQKYDDSYSMEKSRRLEEMLNESEISGDGYPFSEGIFTYFGAESIESLDYSGYEGTSLISDLNMPVHESLREKFSFVFDGGTLEHCFNFYVAMKNCMDMVRIDSHLMLITPSNNYLGHGFYQFSPELFFALLDTQNGFSDTKIFTWDKCGRWYEVISPKDSGGRIEISYFDLAPTQLVVISRKIGRVPDLLSVFQSDYEASWNANHHSDAAGVSSSGWNFAIDIYKKIPQKLRKNISRFLRVILRLDYYRHKTRLKKFCLPLKGFPY
jgi:hypothetical protein